jgi:hypothetical protein
MAIEIAFMVSIFWVAVAGSIWKTVASVNKLRLNKERK